MFEKVNPSHPDKVADRIAGALVDLAYAKSSNPKIAVEVLIGHGTCNIIVEGDVWLDSVPVADAVRRISEDESIVVNYKWFPQDVHLANNQKGTLRCGDNGIFIGMPTNLEESNLTRIVKILYSAFPTDGKYILSDSNLIACQSCAPTDLLTSLMSCLNIKALTVNPLGDWTGGVNVDTGATNRKLGSDMGRAVSGGGLHGKDLSKADVSINIYAHLLAQKTRKPVYICCAIGDETVAGRPYADIVAEAGEYIKSLGGFEKFAEWGLIN